MRQKSNVKYYYNSEFNLIYLTVADDVNCIESIYLASVSSARLNMTATERIRNAILKNHAHECSSPENVQLILTIIDSNTTIVYYKLTHGMISLDSILEEGKSTRSKRTVNPKNIAIVTENSSQKPSTSSR